LEVGECTGIPSPCWRLECDLIFSNDFSDGSISGTYYDVDTSECQGTVTGTFSRKPYVITLFRSGRWYFDVNGNGKWDGSGVDNFSVCSLSGDTPIVYAW